MKALVLCLCFLISTSLSGAVLDTTNNSSFNLSPVEMDLHERDRHGNNFTDEVSPFSRDIYHFQFQRIYERVPASVEDFLPQDDFRNLIRNCWYRCRFD
jgi:hypothetical protein